MRVAIIGSGIGGLTAAAASRRAGIEVAVYEQASALGEVGAGLQMGPSGVKVLRALGLGAALDRFACEPAQAVSLQWRDGRERSRTPSRGAMVETYGAPYLTLHRADLHRALAELIPEKSIHLGRRCVGVTQDERGATVRFADGGTAEADIVVGCDGIKSVLRETLFGADRPRFTNQIAWRGIVPAAALPASARGGGGAVWDAMANITGWIGPTGHVISYPIAGGRLLNIFAGRVLPGEWAEESWSVQSSRDELFAAYAGWSDDLLDVFRACDGWFKWGIFDRDPLPEWSVGRVTLLGDAAHPMMPTLAQGAAIAIEDGYSLAYALAKHPDDPVAALAAYEADRRPRASRVQRQAREQFLNNQKVPAPPPLDRDWIFAYDATRGADFAAE